MPDITEVPKAIHHSHQLQQMDLGETITLFEGEGPDQGIVLGMLWNAEDFPCLEEEQVENVETICLAFADKVVRAYNSHDALLEACENCLLVWDSNSVSVDPDEVKAMLQAAIVKARGGNNAG